jgi:hypothetical protein
MSSQRTSRTGGTTTALVRAVFTALTASAAGCGLQGGTVNMPKRMPTVSVYSFGVVACAVPVAADAGCPKPIPNAIISIHTSGGYASKTADAKGYARFASSLSTSDMKIEAPGFVTIAVGIEPPKLDGKSLTLSLTPVK